MKETFLKPSKKPFLISDDFELSYLTLLKKIRSFRLHQSCKTNKVGLIAHLDAATITNYLCFVYHGISVALLNPKDPLDAIKEKAMRLGIVDLFESSQESNLSLNKQPLPNQKIWKREINGVASYLFTSGSSGNEKIVALSFENHLYSAEGITKELNLNSESRYLLMLPLNHVAGISILYRCLVVEACAMITKEKDPYIATKNTKATHVSFVTTQLARYLEKYKGPTTLKAILLGGSFVDPKIIQKACEKNIPLYLSYGLSEMSSTVTLGKVRISNGKQSSGFVLKGRNIEFSKDQEILVSGDTLFLGYVDTKTQSIQKQTIPFATGDFGHYSKEKGLFVECRKDNMFISGGENIYPEEIEETLCSFSSIQKAVVVPIKDKEYGFVGVAFVKIDPPFNEKDIVKKLRLHLPNYKIPKHFERLPSNLSFGLKVTRLIREELRKRAQEIFSSNLQISSGT